MCLTVREQTAIKSATTGKEEILFVSFCIEMYARRHGMDGGDVLRLFDEKGVCDFLLTAMIRCTHKVGNTYWMR